jgi:hypothetical protein
MTAPIVSVQAKPRYDGAMWRAIRGRELISVLCRVDFYKNKVAPRGVPPMAS